MGNSIIGRKMILMRAQKHAQKVNRAVHNDLLFLKEIFLKTRKKTHSNALTYEEFEQKLGETKEIKLANLESGNYVDKDKYTKLEKKYNDYVAKYGNLQETTKDYETLKANFDDVTAKYNALLTKQDEAEKLAEIDNANVNSKFAKFVYSEVNGLVNDGKDFKTALSEYLKDNAQFLKAGQGTFVNLQNGNGGTKSDNDKFNEQLRRRR